MRATCSNGTLKQTRHSTHAQWITEITVHAVACPWTCERMCFVQHNKSNASLMLTHGVTKEQKPVRWSLLCVWGQRLFSKLNSYKCWKHALSSILGYSFEIGFTGNLCDAMLVTAHRICFKPNRCVQYFKKTIANICSLFHARLEE